MLTTRIATKPMGNAHGAARPRVCGAAMTSRPGFQAGMSFDGINVGTTTRPLGRGAPAG